MKSTGYFGTILIKTELAGGQVLIRVLNSTCH